ncbi:MAG: cytochrome c peroxidase [Planctomycetota bacterium]
MTSAAFRGWLCVAVASGPVLVACQNQATVGARAGIAPSSLRRSSRALEVDPAVGPLDAAAGRGATQRGFTYEPLDPRGEPVEPIPSDVELFFEDYLERDYRPALIELGRSLFHDPRLSTDNSLSCASCHDLRYGGVDRAVTATGYHGQIGVLNTPTVFNAVLHLSQFWDGRAPDLETQADGPPQAPTEMASSWKEILVKLDADALMTRQFRTAFPEVDFAAGIRAEHVQMAIAEFERTLITPNAPFDQYLMGDPAAVSEEVKEGYQVFKDVGCIECHNGMAIGARSYQRLGRSKDYFVEEMAHGPLGRMDVTGEESDRFVFKVGSLRNVALTGPYLHDGSVETLEQVIRLMGHYQLDIELTGGQVRRIAAFLRSLTGEFGGQPLLRIQNTVAHPAPATPR